MINLLLTVGCEISQCVKFFLLTVTEHEDTDDVTLTCSVTSDACWYKTTWLYESKNIAETGETPSHMKTSQSGCESNVTFPTSSVQLNTNDLQKFSCKVTDDNKKETVFTFSRQSSGEIMMTLNHSAQLFLVTFHVVTDGGFINSLSR